MSVIAPPSLTAISIRAALAARCGADTPPGAWRAAAAIAGVSGADAFLCHLSQSIAGALERLATSSESARVRIRSARDARADRDDVATSRCDELESRAEAAECFKRAALERELCAIDVVLEQLRAGRDAAAEAAASLADSELVASHDDLMARLDAADTRLIALPTSVIEPPYVGLVMDESALLAGSAVFGRVVAPRAIHSADLTVEGVPNRTYPGCALLHHLVLQGTHHVLQSAEELEVSLGAAAAATHIEASLETEGAAPQPLQADATADIPRRCVVIKITVPGTATIGSSVCFGPLTVFGQPVAGLLLGTLRVEAPCPVDLSPEHAAWLQSQLPPGGSSCPGEWEEVYRATTHGFGAEAFHARCDGRERLLVLVRAQEGGWLFGGFTATGFIPGPARWYADRSAFLFSLINSLGYPEKRESKHAGDEIFYDPSWSAFFFGGLCICNNADTIAESVSLSGYAFAESASTGAHPMAQMRQAGWLAAEVVAWTV